MFSSFVFPLAPQQARGNFHPARLAETEVAGSDLRGQATAALSTLKGILEADKKAALTRLVGDGGDGSAATRSSIESLRAMLQPTPSRRPLALASGHTSSTAPARPPAHEDAKENVHTTATTTTAAVVGSTFKRQPKLPKHEDEEIAALSSRIRQRLLSGPTP
jgi:hypothetical protein